MELDLGTALVGLIVLVLCALPFILDQRRRAGRRKELLNNLEALAQKHQCQINRSEVCGDTVLGLDGKRNALFYFRDHIDHPTVAHVDLNTMRKATAVTSMRHGADALPDRMELCLRPAHLGRDEVRLLLFQAGPATPPNGEHLFADKWERLINERLRGN